MSESTSSERRSTIPAGGGLSEELLNRYEFASKLKDMGYDYIYNVDDEKLFKVDFFIENYNNGVDGDYLIGFSEDWYPKTGVYQFMGIEREVELRYRFYEKDELFKRLVEESDILP